MQNHQGLSGKSSTDLLPVFAVDPWSVLETTWKSLTGYLASDFDFVRGLTPMSTFNEAISMITLYYVTIFAGRELMRNREPMKLQTLFIIHNFILTAVSGGLLILFAQELLPGLWRNGLHDGICGETGWSQRLLVLYYLNYLTKYLELLDTVFLVLRKKPLTFLHTYHHGATALLCYTQLVGKTPVSWVPITLNLGVHVVMYWYYFQSARGIRVWWKQFITGFQITQFVLDLGFIYYATWNFFATHYLPLLPHYKCGRKGQGLAAATGCAILTSYLFLFIGFYIATYKKAPTKPAAKKAARRASMCELPTAAEVTAPSVDAIRSATASIAQSAGFESSTSSSRT